MSLLFLATPEINRLLGPLTEHTVRYQDGFFSIYRKLHLGMGVTLVALPSLRGDCVELSIPLSRVRGDKTGGFAPQLAKVLWGPVQSQVEKALRGMVSSQGLPANTVEVRETTTAQGEKAGLISINARLIANYLVFPKLGVEPVLQALQASPGGLEISFQMK